MRITSGVSCRWIPAAQTSFRRRRASYCNALLGQCLNRAPSLEHRMGWRWRSAVLPSAPMRRQSVTVSFGLLAIACAGLFTGCEVKTDLGVPCLLVRKDPADTNPNDGYSYLPIL